MILPTEAVIGLLRHLESIGCRVEMCGSQVTCDPRPTASDVDYLVELPHGDADLYPEITLLLRARGYLCESEKYNSPLPTEGFASWRIWYHDGPEVNLLLTQSASFAAKHRVATALCTRLNLMWRDDRVALFQAVLYAVDWKRKGSLINATLNR